MSYWKNIFAWTPNVQRPPFVSINRLGEQDDGMVHIHVRSGNPEGDSSQPYYGNEATVKMPYADFESMAWALARHFGIIKE